MYPLILSSFHMQIRKAKEIQRNVDSFQSDMEHIEAYKPQYEILKQNIGKHISTLEQKRRWSLCGGTTIIIAIIAIILQLGVLLLIKSNTHSGKFLHIILCLLLRLGITYLFYYMVYLSHKMYNSHSHSWYHRS